MGHKRQKTNSSGRISDKDNTNERAPNAHSQISDRVMDMARQLQKAHDEVGMLTDLVSRLVVLREENLDDLPSYVLRLLYSQDVSNPSDSDSTIFKREIDAKSRIKDNQKFVKAVELYRSDKIKLEMELAEYRKLKDLVEKLENRRINQEDKS